MNCRVFVAFLFVLPFCVTPVFAQTYSYPVIPDSIVDKTEREAYMAYHFWDHADFSDSALLSKPKLVLDYLYLIRDLSTSQREACFRNTISSASANFHVYNNLLFWLERYLHNPHSPYFSDEVFIQVIDIMLESSLEEENVMDLLYLKEMLQKNQIGAVAEDFKFVSMDGSTIWLHDVESPLLLLVFNSPDCSSCHDLEKEISNDNRIQQMLSDGRLKILAVSPVADYEDWLKHDYPKNWICGFDEGKTIVKGRLYEINQFPSIYLLDENKRVLIKEADYELLTNALFGRKS